jgi:hypothetical protein
MKTLDGTLYRRALDCSGPQSAHTPCVPMDTWHRAPLRSKDSVGRALQVGAGHRTAEVSNARWCRRQWCPERRLASGYERPLNCFVVLGEVAAASLRQRAEQWLVAPPCWRMRGIRSCLGQIALQKSLAVFGWLHSAAFTRTPVALLKPTCACPSRQAQEYPWASTSRRMSAAEP